MKVIIAGGRNFNDYNLLKLKCNEILANLTDVEIVSGCADGADRLGELYAKDFKYKLKRFPANWGLNGNSAGVIRNKEMANYSDILIAFWDERSKGTQNMIKTAKELNLTVNVFYY
jgi:hypothetical protein